MALYSFGSNKSSIHPLWVSMTVLYDIDEALNQSLSNPSIIFKHSTRCSISSMALNRFESSIDNIPTPCSFYFLDLLAYRNISDEIANRLNVQHQSPQVILLIKNEVIYTTSHGQIDANVIANEIHNHANSN